MQGIPGLVKRRMIVDDLRGEFEGTIEQRVDRYIEVSHQTITPNPHFAAASSECIGLYTHGFFFSTVMVTQAVAEGIRNFVVIRNGIKRDDGLEGPQIAELLVEKGFISSECAGAFNRIWRSFRDDLHHMNPEVAEIPARIPFSELARRNIQDLAAIEREVFAFEMRSGAIIPVHKQYWDISPDGTAPVFLRLSP